MFGVVFNFDVVCLQEVDVVDVVSSEPLHPVDFKWITFHYIISALCMHHSLARWGLHIGMMDGYRPNFVFWVSVSFGNYYLVPL